MRDQAVFAQVFDAYAKAVHNHAFRLTANWPEAEDVVALTFLYSSFQNAVRSLRRQMMLEAA